MATQLAFRVESEAPAHAVPHGPIDMAFLAKQTLGDENLALEVLRLFDEMTKTYYARLETSTTVPDLLQHLHTLRGAASGVGAFALAELAKTAEEDLRAGKPVDPERIDDLGVAVNEASAFIAEHVAAA